MLKTTVSSQVLVADEVLAANKVDGVEGGDESIEKYGKLSKTRKLFKFRKLFKSKKSKSRKTSKSRNLAKSGKKLSKNRNSTNFDATEDGPKFLTFDARTGSNRLWLAFTEAPILRYFDPEYHIWINTDASDYAISGVLS